MQSLIWGWIRQQPTDNNCVDMRVFHDRVLPEHVTNRLLEYLYFLFMFVILTDETIAGVTFRCGAALFCATASWNCMRVHHGQLFSNLTTQIYKAYACYR